MDQAVTSGAKEVNQHLGELKDLSFGHDPPLPLSKPHADATGSGRYKLIPTARRHGVRALQVNSRTEMIVQFAVVDGFWAIVCL
jgi:hypothetical protein